MQGHRRVLILGGTAEARDVAAQLVDRGFDVTTSLAGVTQEPALPAGKLRIGGFGGAAGLAKYIADARMELLVDATHPFAAQMSAHAQAAAAATGTCLVRLERPEWQRQPGDDWIEVGTMAEAVAAMPASAHVFVTTGRRHLDVLLNRRGVTGVIRTVEALDFALPAGWQALLGRPPHAFHDELALFTQHGFTHLLSKNAGGHSSFAKIAAARMQGLPVIMVARPWKPPCDVAETVEALLLRLGRATVNG